MLLWTLGPGCSRAGPPRVLPVTRDGCPDVSALSGHTSSTPERDEALPRRTGPLDFERARRGRLLVTTDTLTRGTPEQATVPRQAAAAYDIAEVAELTGLSAHTLRYYERAGLVRSPARDATGRRRYDDSDLSWLRFLTRLRSTGMPIRVVRDYVELCWAGDGNEAERLEILEAHRDVLRERLAQAQHDLEHIDRKIAVYRKALP